MEGVFNVVFMKTSKVFADNDKIHTQWEIKFHIIKEYTADFDTNLRFFLTSFSGNHP